MCISKNTEVAFKYKMPPVAAAIGLGQVERAEELVARKREIFEWYRGGLEGVGGVTLNHEPANTKNTYWMVTGHRSDARMAEEKLMAALDTEGIDSRPMFHPLSCLSAYEGMRKQRWLANEMNPANASAHGALICLGVVPHTRRCSEW